ncbi:uncharacterized protein LOC109507388 [Hippocampus comes]|uniref:uncharacterized protein LOC109507388 n=1 Tax=Hippocampus comes TaxID=109280 RepID=UPI00094E03E6|nr:PREDICTED: uncharacterized protein LOC109507388 [Hippocampus comes]
MKVGTNSTADICIEDVPGNSTEAEHDVGPEGAHIPSLDNVVEKVTTVRQDEMTPNESDQDGTSEADKMAAELRALISEFMQTVDEFKRNVSDMSGSTEEQQTMLRSLLEAQDQLERKYMSKKEEHRALEMQNYLGLCRNIGTFDPNRLVEGDIFRVGMHLEDIKEMIDKNMHKRVVPPLLSSTPTTRHQSAKASLPPSLHEGSSVNLTTECLRTETKTEAQKEDETGKNDRLEDRSEPLSNDSLQVNNRLSVCPEVSAEGPLDADADAEQFRGEEKQSASLEGRARSSDPWSGIIGKWKSGSGMQDGAVNRECDVGDGASLAVEVSSSSDACSSLAQGAVCRETDSGFGSSYLNRSGGIPQLNPSTERVPSDGLGTPDSEGSSFHLLTTVHPKDVSSQRQKSPVQAQPEGSAATVEQWVQNILKKSSLELQGPDANNRYASETILSPLMDVEQRQRHLCSCNSEAILALQVEVSRLKKDLEKGLVQLPHLARKMDYLASKYRQDRQERRSKTKSRAYHKTTSLWKSTSSRQSLRDFSSSQLALDDWISTDMDPSRSKEAIMDNLYSKNRRLLLALQPTQRPLLQLNYGSSCSLPASYKVKEPPTHVTNDRKRSTQSDTALLPSEVYFQPTLPHVFQTPGSRTGSKEEEMNRTLDQAIEAARSMKKTTDRMAKRLTADLAKAQLLPKGECAAFSGEGARNIAWLHTKRA